MNDSKAKKRGKQPSGVVTKNVCVRMTDESHDYARRVGNGSATTGIAKIIVEYAGQNPAFGPAPLVQPK